MGSGRDRDCILAIDQGTSSTKSAVFDRGGSVRARGSAPLASSYPRPGFVEQDPEEIWRSVLQSVRACLAAFRAAGGEAARIVALGISNQRETFLLWDDSGRPITPAVVWQCKRSVAVCDRLRAEGVEEEIRRSTGLILDPYFSGTKLLWLVENDSDVASAVRSGRACFGTVDAWLLHRLTAGACHATDYTNASRTLLFDIDTLEWNRALLERWGLGELRLPEPCPSAHRFGESDVGGLLPAPVPITGAIGDSHAAAFGEGCVEPGMAKATMGTGSSILMDVGERRADAQGGTVATVCWSLPGRVDYALEGIIVSCGSTLSWMQEALGLYRDVSEIEAMARSVPDSRGVDVVPGWGGMGAPWWRMDARGSIHGLTFGTRASHIARAALETIPFQIADVVHSMEAASGIRLAELRVDGGISANAFVMELLADLLVVPVLTIGLAEVSALGAAYMAGLGAGLYGGLDELRSIDRSQRRHLPGPGAPAARERHAAWRRTVAKALG